MHILTIGKEIVYISTRRRDVLNYVLESLTKRTLYRPSTRTDLCNHAPNSARAVFGICTGHGTKLEYQGIDASEIETWYKRGVQDFVVNPSRQGCSKPKGLGLKLKMYHYGFYEKGFYDCYEIECHKKNISNFQNSMIMNGRPYFT